MPDVRAHVGQSERRELAAHRDALIDLPHLRHLQVRPELGLANQDDLQELLPLFEVRKDPDLFEQRQRKVLRFVDDDDGERLQGDERVEKLVQRVAQIWTGSA